MTDHELEKINSISEEIMKLTHDELLMNMRFLDSALFNLKVTRVSNNGVHVFTGNELLFSNVKLIADYKTHINKCKRLYLHTLLHCVFSHAYDSKGKDKKLWDLATDIAVESVALDFELAILSLPTDDLLLNRINNIKKEFRRIYKGNTSISAQKIYKYFLIEELSDDGYEEWVKLTKYDEHLYWDIKEEIEYSNEQWQKIAESIKADLKSFSKGKTNSESLEENLNIATREKYDYSEFLRRFMVMSENLSINDDEFDYIYYTYGMKLYDNMPLIEPLEYKDSNKIKEFVIAIDTSASCKGELVKAFLERTVNILRDSENFFNKINIHIIQCDNQVRSDTVIRDKDDFSQFMNEYTVIGFGSTDFRPVFDYVDEMIENEQFSDLKGLIYFTDGYGIYPETKKNYDVAFVFLNDDENAPKVPPWAIKVILTEEDIMINE